MNDSLESTTDIGLEVREQLGVRALGFSESSDAAMKSYSNPKDLIEKVLEQVQLSAPR